MDITASFHSITALKFGPVRYFPPTTERGPFWTRSLSIEGGGQPFELPLYANLAGALLLPGEKPVEGEKVPQTGTGEPESALEPAVLTDGQADSLLEQVRRTF